MATASRADLARSLAHHDPTHPAVLRAHGDALLWASLALSPDSDTSRRTLAGRKDNP